MLETYGSYTVLARFEHLTYPNKIGYQQYSSKKSSFTDFLLCS